MTTTDTTERRSWPRRHKLLTGLGLAATVLGIAGAIGGTSGHGKPLHHAAQPASPAAATSSPPAAPAPPTPNPQGTYQGSCNYTIASSPSQQDTLTGEVDVTNTGNIGTVVRVRISWPQEGYAPIARHRTVRVRPGATKAVRFHVPVGNSWDGSNVISNLQAWQTGHGLRDGCRYRGGIVNTFGQAQG